MPDRYYAMIASPALGAAANSERLEECVLVPVPFEFVMDRCQSPTLNALLSRRVSDRARPFAEVYLRGERYFARVSFRDGPAMIVALDVWAWENKR